MRGRDRRLSAEDCGLGVEGEGEGLRVEGIGCRVIFKLKVKRLGFGVWVLGFRV